MEAIDINLASNWFFVSNNEECPSVNVVTDEVDEES